MLDRTAIAARIPHTGRMCLLDRVAHWDENCIECATMSHRDQGNPLREHGGLPVWSGIEYAAQAAAVHGTLIREDAPPRLGLLGSLRNVEASCGWLNDVEGELIIAADLLHGDPAGGIYRFELRTGYDLILQGQLTLMLLRAPAQGLKG